MIVIENMTTWSVRCPNERKILGIRFPHSYIGNGQYSPDSYDKHCNTCGTKLVKIYHGVNCRKCGKYYSTKQKHCDKCGAKITEKPKHGWAHFSIG